MAHRSTTETDQVEDPLDDWRPRSPNSWRDRLEVTLDQRPELGGRRPLLMVLALVVAVVIAVWLFRPVPPPVESVIPLATTGGPASTTPSANAASTSSAPNPDLVVQAAGAVTSPGVYRLSAGARVDDLLRAAGGVADGADLDRVNLAAPVADGERVWVPKLGEEPPAVVSGKGAAAPPATGGSAEDEVAIVNINTASATELETLPGVGPATADAILTYRDAQGGFSSVDELLEVRGIGEAKLEAVRPLVVV